jgi:biopolymer transport protein TolR
MSANRRHNNRMMNEINVVPYIDVMLVLLVIFMVTAPMMSPSQIDLPQVGKSSETSPAPLEVVVRKNGTLSLRDHAKGENEIRVSRDELIQVLKSRTGQQAKQAVVISADKNVRYDDVISVMDALQQQNIQKVGLLTKLKAQ